MKKILTLAWREYQSFFRSKASFIILLCVYFLACYLFVSYLASYNLAVKQVSYDLTRLETVNIESLVVENYFLSIFVLNLILIPVIIPRSFVEERKSGSWKLLTTYPLSHFQLAAGKLLSPGIILATIQCLLGLIPFVLLVFVDLDLVKLLFSLFALILCSFSLLSLCLLCNFFVANYILSGLLSFFILAILYSVHLLPDQQFSFLPELIEVLSPFAVFQDLLMAVVSLSSVFTILSTIIFSVLLLVVFVWFERRGNV